MITYRFLWFIGILSLLCLMLTSGCSAAGGERNPETGVVNQAAAPLEAEFTASLTPQPSRTLAITARVTATATLTATPTQTATITVTPTATLHPMQILAMRQTPYPGSEITIETELERGANYSRYYASYLSEGLKIYGLLTVPDGDPPPGGFPGIIFNHGYIPPSVYRTTERYIAYVDALARSGYIVFRIDYRGHDRSEGQPSGAYGDPGYAVDVLNAFSSLQRFGLTNPERIGMWGHSMGGYLTLRAMVISPEIKAGVIWAGVVAPYEDLLTRWRRSSGPTSTPAATGSRSWRSTWSSRYGSPQENPDFWNGVSANSYLDELSGPLQLHHGTADADVPLEFSEILAGQLQSAGQPYEFYIYEGDNHNLSVNFSTAMLRTIVFFDRYLKDAP